MDSASENVVALAPAALTAIFIGLVVIIFTFLIKWIKQEDSQKGVKKHEKPSKAKSTSSDASGKHGKKEQTGTVKQSSKKKLTERENRRTARNTEKGFSHPWILATLKGHTGRVLDMDFSSNGKYLASCGDEDPDPGGLSSTTTDSSSSSSESNKDNSLPSSQSPSPVIKKGLSRRQRKNRKREHTQATLVPKEKPETKVKEQKNSSNKSQKKNKRDAKMNLCYDIITAEQLAVFNNLIVLQGCGGFKPLEEYRRLNLSDRNLAIMFQVNYALDQLDLAKLGYPVRPNSKKGKLDVHAQEFVPRSENGDSGNGSGSSSDEDNISTDGSERSASGMYNRKGVYCHICSRCGAFFYATSTKYVSYEGCSYHWGGLRYMYPGYGPLVYTCCNTEKHSPGCTRAKLHVWNGPNAISTSSFVETEPRNMYCKFSYAVLSLDCEMSYTVQGLEVVKVSVVDMQGMPVYNAFVMPKTPIVDYNTRFSGVTALDFQCNTKPLCVVQRELKEVIRSETVLIGHGLENDLKALKMIHKNIVDTSHAFPHYKGLPYRNSLKTLTKRCLKRDIQCSETGHDSFEDARACMELMLFRLRRDMETCDYIDVNGQIIPKSESK